MSTQAEFALKKMPTPAEPALKKNIFLAHAQRAFTLTQAAVTQTAAVRTVISNSKDDSNNMTTHNSRNANNSRNESKSRTANTVGTPTTAGML
jgi:hypothetical protein